jgi:cell division protein ZipA
LAEFRWILLGLGLLLIVGIWWWGARRSRQAPGNAELRESTAASAGSAPQAFARSAREAAAPEMPPEEIDSSREWGVPPLEPLSIRTADFERVPALEQPMMAEEQPRMAEFEEVDLPMDLDTGRVAVRREETDRMADFDRTADLTRTEGDRTEGDRAEGGAAEPGRVEPYIEEFDVVKGPRRADAPRAAAPQALPPEAAPTVRPPHQPPYQPAPVPRLRPSTENSDRLAAVTAAPQVPNASERQRIVTIRVCTVGEARWSGEALMAALELHGLAYGRYQVYHRKHSDGRSIFCVASLVEPGTFDIARMPEEDFRGVTLFAVLPGPLEAVQTVDALFATARDLARDLSGTVQDAKGMPFSPQRTAALREDVARFQSALSS